jgi:FixJ family two-component response regulator
MMYRSAAIRHALERSRVVLSYQADMQALRERHASLTPRERQVMVLVVSGLLNKQVGGELGINQLLKRWAMVAGGTT